MIGKLYPLVELRSHDLSVPFGDAGPADAVVSGLASWP